MKATELMCDDIVLHHGNAYKVFGIMGKANAVDLFPVQLRNAEGMILGPLTCFATEIAPIPLTPEILEKNLEKECEDKIDGGLYFNVEDSKVWGILDEEGFWLNFNGQQDMILIHYAHQLQNALRLCGLNDLADNFKV